MNKVCDEPKYFEAYTVFENPKRFWSYIKRITKTNQQPNFLRDGQNFVSDPVGMANMLNHFFHSVLNFGTNEPPEFSPINIPEKQLSNIQLTVYEVSEVLHSLDANKASGPDNLPNRILVGVADEIAPSICRLFNLSLSEGIMPKRWKLANITAIFKKNDPTIPSNYRPISLLDTSSKVLERCVYNHCYEHLHSMFHYLQHGFLRGRSTNTQLLVVYHQILECIASGQEVDAIYLDFSKAFDKVPHNLLLLKLKSYGISDPTLSWFGSYLSERHQRVVIN